MDKLLKKEEKEDESCIPKMSYRNRIYGFVICFVLGLIISVLSSITFMLGAKLEKFAILYTLGNIISIASSCFLSGPRSQFKSMKHKTRIITVCVFILSMVMTLISAIVIKKKPLTLLFIIIQYIAYFWYSLSFIPYARKILKKTVKGCCFDEEAD